MKKIIWIIALLFNYINLQAQSISNVSMLEIFYNNYFTYCATNDARLDSLITSNCTPAFAQAWNKDVNEIGLYDPLTNGYCENYDMMKSSLSVQKETDHYIVSFHYLTWPDNHTQTEKVIIFVNKNGKISHTKRPSDGYMTPDL